MPLRLAAAMLLVASLALPAQQDRGRPIILLLHGRGMLDRDTAETRKMWLNELTSAAKSLAREPLVSERDVRLVWYADVLDPRSTETCDYDRNDPRARRDAKTDPNLKSLVSLVGGVFSAMTNMVNDSESAMQLRAFAGDASFLSDVHKRCASGKRLADALDRARSEGRPVILVAHSLGAVLAYDYLSARPDTAVVQRLVSFGSLLGAAEIRHLLIGGDSTDAFVSPPSVKMWINVRNDGDVLATPLSFGRDLLATPPADEHDRHDMVTYLRGATGAGAVLGGWCSAFIGKPPAGCTNVTKGAP